MIVLFDLLQKFYMYYIKAKKNNFFWRALLEIDVIRWKICTYFALRSIVDSLNFGELIYEYAKFIKAMAGANFIADNSLMPFAISNAKLYIAMRDLTSEQIASVVMKYNAFDSENGYTIEYNIKVKSNDSETEYVVSISYACIPIDKNISHFYSKTFNYIKSSDNISGKDITVQRSIENIIRKEIFTVSKDLLFNAIKEI